MDLHALTVPQVPAKLRERCLSFVAQYIACGITPEKSCIAIQSHVREHAELAWVLNTLASMGEPFSKSRYCPMASKCSYPNPMGSVRT